MSRETQNVLGDLDCEFSDLRRLSEAPRVRETRVDDPLPAPRQRRLQRVLCRAVVPAILRVHLLPHRAVTAVVRPHRHDTHGHAPQLWGEGPERGRGGHAADGCPDGVESQGAAGQGTVDGEWVRGGGREGGRQQALEGGARHLRREPLGAELQMEEGGRMSLVLETDGRD